MFEKEAKERAEEIEANQTLGVYDNDEDFARDEGWNDGYVSGYEEGFQNGAEFGYNKANEWHYVKDGDLPLQTTLVLIKACGCFILGWLDDNDVWHNDSDNGASIPKDNIYAWKEIVLPKEIKENE